jgi:hypothetical protein
LFVVELPSASTLLLVDLEKIWKAKGVFTAFTLATFEGRRAILLNQHVAAWTTGSPPK